MNRRDGGENEREEEAKECGEGEQEELGEGDENVVIQEAEGMVDCPGEKRAQRCCKGKRR